MDQKSAQTPVLWERAGSVQNRLREPKVKLGPSQSAANQGTGPPAQQTASKTTVLNVNAPEFVPTWLKPSTESLENKFQNVHISIMEPQPQSSYTKSRPQAQDRLKKIKTPSIQSSESSSSCGSTQSELSNGYCDNDDSTDMARLKQIISSLIMYPGQFDDLFTIFMETIYPYFSDILAMSEIAQLLVSQAISCPNFRYNGARLCWYVEQKCPTFRADLHMRCQKELHENPNQQNVVLFIAELYIQLPHDSLYGSLLIDSLKKLLHIGGSDNIKCVCQALKLTGYSLEQNQKPALDELFFQLRDFASVLSGSALILLNSVINLRECHWGRATSESIHSDSSDYDQDYEEMVNGILYETEGHQLTNEEQEFLAVNAGHDEYCFDNEDPDGLCDPEPEMDEEIQAAFEEFIKLSKG